VQGKRILLIIGGGIAAFKCPDLIRRLTDQGARVRCILTAAGAQFVTPLTLSALTGDKVYGALFDLTDEAEMGHIQLSRDADLVVVAPATADLMAKMAAGLADDLASTALLATDKPVLVAPAMNVRMWEHAATRRNELSLFGNRTVAADQDVLDIEDGVGRVTPRRVSDERELVEPRARKAHRVRLVDQYDERLLIPFGPDRKVVDAAADVVDRIDDVPRQCADREEGHLLAPCHVEEHAIARLEPETDPVLLQTKVRFAGQRDVQGLFRQGDQHREVQVQLPLGHLAEEALKLRELSVAGHIADLDGAEAAQAVSGGEPDAAFGVLVRDQGVGARLDGLALEIEPNQDGGVLGLWESLLAPDSGGCEERQHQADRRPAPRCLPAHAPF